MSGRFLIARVALVLVAAAALLAVPSDTALTDPAGTDPAGTKVAHPPEAGVVALPASTQIGTWILTVLLLSASSVAMLGGGLWQRVMAGGAQASARERQAEAPEASAKRSPKDKPKRAFSRQSAPLDRRARRGWNVAWRNANQVKPRRRGIGGCRGVR